MGRLLAHTTVRRGRVTKHTSLLLLVCQRSLSRPPKGRNLVIIELSTDATETRKSVYHVRFSVRNSRGNYCYITPQGKMVENRAPQYNLQQNQIKSKTDLLHQIFKPHALAVCPALGTLLFSNYKGCSQYFSEHISRL